MNESKKTFITKLCKILMNNKFANKKEAIDKITIFLDKHPKNVVNLVLNMFEKEIFSNENIRDKFVYQKRHKHMFIVYNLLTYLYDINRYIKERTINNNLLQKIEDKKFVYKRRLLKNDVEYIEDIIVIHYNKLNIKDLKQIYDQLEHKIDMKITKHNPKSKKEFLNAILKWIQETRTFVYKYTNIESKQLESKQLNINQKLKIQEELKEKLPQVLQYIVLGYNVGDMKLKLNYKSFTKPIIIRLLNDLNKIHGKNYLDFKESESKKELFKYLSDKMTVNNFTLLLSYKYSNSKVLKDDIRRYEIIDLTLSSFSFTDKSFKSDIVNVIPLSEIRKVLDAVRFYHQKPIPKWIGGSRSKLIAKLLSLLTIQYINISNNEKVSFIDLKNVMNDTNKCLNFNKSDLINILMKIYYRHTELPKKNKQDKIQKLIEFPKIVLCKMIRYAMI